MRCWMLLSVALALNLYGAEVYEFKPKPKKQPVVVEEPLVEESLVDNKPVFEKSIIKQAKAAVQAGLVYEPDAVQFRNVQSIYGEAGLEFVCGEFNPVSEQGEYIGYVRFTFRANRLLVEHHDATFSEDPGDALSGFASPIDSQDPILDCR